MLALLTLLAVTSSAGKCQAYSEQALLAGQATPPVRSARWDGKSDPKYLDHVSQRLALSKEDLEHLRKDGFVVPARLRFASYGWAFHELFQSELPLYVSADAILHSVYVSNDNLIADLERERLLVMLDKTLSAMHQALPKEPGLPPEVAHDLDVYLTVARSLSGATNLAPATDKAKAEAKVLVEKALKAAGMEAVELFGRSRNIDFTQFTPRGHYAGDEKLERYFRASMWLSRLEFNLASRSCKSSHPGDLADPSETPREAVDALALAELVERAHATADLDALDEAWTVLAGRREDVSVRDLRRLREKARIQKLEIPASAAALRAAIGDGFQRTLRMHYMPQGTSTLPAIATLLGPRIVADSDALMPLVEPQTPGRYLVNVADVAYALGHDRALSLMAPDLAQHPKLKEQLGISRAIIAKAPTGPDLYGAWLSAIRALAHKPKGKLPTFMEGEAFQDLRIGSAVASFGQLRHNYVLMAAQGYDQGGCDLSDGFVDPAPEVYEAIASYAQLGLKAFRKLDPKDVAKGHGYFRRLEKLARIFRAVSLDELAGRAVSQEQIAFYNRVLEMTPGSTGAAPTYTGWWFELFRSPEEALKDAAFVADYQTSGYEQKVSYAGVEGVRLGVFTVDIGGVPRVFVGPVTRAYEHHGPLAKRLDDEAAKALAESERSDPWAKSYTVAAPPAPSLKLSYQPGFESEEPAGKARVEEVKLTGKGAAISVTVELLDHHRKPIASKTQPVGEGEATFTFELGKKAPKVESIHVRSGAFDDWADCSWAGAFGQWGTWDEGG